MRTLVRGHPELSILSLMNKTVVRGEGVVGQSEMVITFVKKMLMKMIIKFQ